MISRATQEVVDPHALAAGAAKEAAETAAAEATNAAEAPAAEQLWLRQMEEGVRETGPSSLVSLTTGRGVAEDFR